jgi:hypothetical protein
LVKPVGPQVQETRKVGTDSSGRRARRQFAWRFAALGVLSVLAVAPGRAADTVYTIANYPVEASAENAVAAKDRAIGDGQQAAFRSMLKRLVPVTQYPRLQKLDSVRAAELVEGVKVRSERNSRTDYIASFDFAFQAKSVRDLLRREGISFVDEQAPTLTVVAVWRGPGSDNAAWTNVWRGLDLENALTPVNLQPLRPDIAAEAVEGIARSDPSAMRVFAGAYASEHLVVAVGQQEGGKMKLLLVGRDAVGPLYLERAYRLDADASYTRELSAVIALRTLEGRWKAIKATGGGRPGGSTLSTAAGRVDLLVAVEFRGMAEWQDISRKLAATPGVEELDVAGLSARGARVTMRYGGAAEQLAGELARQGLVLRNNGGTWVLSSR